jgi:hypothetical protein
VQGERLGPGKSDYRTFEVMLHFSGYGVYQELGDSLVSFHDHFPNDQ